MIKFPIIKLFLVVKKFWDRKILTKPRCSYKKRIKNETTAKENVMLFLTLFYFKIWLSSVTSTIATRCQCFSFTLFTNWQVLLVKNTWLLSKVLVWYCTPYSSSQQRPEQFLSSPKSPIICTYLIHKVFTVEIVIKTQQPAVHYPIRLSFISSFAKITYNLYRNDYILERETTAYSTKKE